MAAFSGQEWATNIVHMYLSGPIRWAYVCVEANWGDGARGRDMAITAFYGPNSDQRMYFPSDPASDFMRTLISKEGYTVVRRELSDPN